ncbi:YrrS family protein [Bacillus solimangrovi]|uniref:DUF1510 domain-containing protein n=1 Tax=Bacillus solimangrovi TaxID=1305675 RepID=A0A1E5LBQ5_9BACI|nr:YrrS family protein [Bacillus solimangrovi]OEH91524.1 hypothetical protein BFG57_05270 [Bacillus solimangrovi]
MPQQSRYQNRRKKKKISGLMLMIAGVFATLLFVLVISLSIGAKEKPEFVYGPTTPETYKDDVIEQEQEQEKDSEKISETEESIESSKETSNTETSEEVVSEVIEGEWDPVETEQEGVHVTSYEEGSADWNEMLRATETATNISQDDMIVWWLGNGGSPNTSTVTVSTKDNTEIYRVQLQWIESKGWQPVTVEVLESNPYQ